MAVVKDETMSIRSSEDVVRVRQVARELAVEQGLSLVDQTKIVTAASELRNSSRRAIVVAKAAERKQSGAA